MERIYYLFHPEPLHLGRTAYLPYIYANLDGIRYEYVMCEAGRFDEAVQQFGRDKNLILSEVKQADLPHPNAPETFIYSEFDRQKSKTDQFRFFEPRPAPYGYWQNRSTQRTAQ
jgi:hypothetical protein